MLILTFEYLQWDLLQVELVRKKKKKKERIALRAKVLFKTVQQTVA